MRALIKQGSYPDNYNGNSFTSTQFRKWSGLVDGVEETRHVHQIYHIAFFFRQARNNCFSCIFLFRYRPVLERSGRIRRSRSGDARSDDCRENFSMVAPEPFFWRWRGRGTITNNFSSSQYKMCRTFAGDWWHPFWFPVWIEFILQNLDNNMWNDGLWRLHVCLSSFMCGGGQPLRMLVYSRMLRPIVRYLKISWLKKQFQRF